jgi:hypothetical protein
MTPQQKDLILNALQIGLKWSDFEINGVQVAEPDNETIRAAIKELEAMPTEIQPNGETK